MTHSFCKTQRYIRGGSFRILVLPCFKDVNFVRKQGPFSFAVRYLSGDATDGHSFTISYLKISCGLSPQSALAASKRVQFETPQKPDSVISFLKTHGFSQTQITNLIKGSPRLLLSNPEKTLLPKLQFFYSRGASVSNLAEILSSRPYVLSYSLHRSIIPNFNFFKDVTQCGDGQVLAVYKCNPRLFARDFQSLAALKLAFLRQCGVPECNVMRMLVKDPSIFTAKSERFKRTVEEVKKLGFNPLKFFFLVAVQVMLQTSELTRERKFNVLKECGWSHEEIVSAFGRFPKVLGYSEHKIKATTDYYVNTVGLKTSYIANSPQLLSYSLEERIIPRFEVFQVLLSEGLIPKISIRRLLSLSEKNFLQMFVLRYEHPHLLKLYEEKLRNSK